MNVVCDAPRDSVRIGRYHCTHRPYVGIDVLVAQVSERRAELAFLRSTWPRGSAHNDADTNVHVNADAAGSDGDAGADADSYSADSNAADSDPGSADTDADGTADGHANADADAGTGSADSDAHANTDADDTADAHTDADADADTGSADSDAHADADADADTGSGSADSDAADDDIDTDADVDVDADAESDSVPDSAADAAVAASSAIADAAADATSSFTSASFPWPCDSTGRDRQGGFDHHGGFALCRPYHRGGFDRRSGFVRFKLFDVVETVGVVHIVRRWHDIEAASSGPVEMHQHPDGTWRLPSNPSDEPHAAIVMYQHPDGTCDVRLLNDLSIVVHRACVQFAQFSLDEATRARVREYQDHLADLEHVVQRARCAALGAPAHANPVADDPNAAAPSDQAAADEPPAAGSDFAAAAHHDTDSDARSANATDPNTAPAARASPNADPATDFADFGASDATDPATANLAAIADFDANLTADTGPTARVDADPAPSATGADVESVASGDPAAADDMAADDLAVSASSYSVRGVGDSVTTSSLSDGSLSSYSIRDALASATSWSFLECSDSASDRSDQSRSDCSSPVRSLVATPPSAVPRAAEPPLAPPGWRAISLEDGVTMYRNLTSGALSLNAREDDVVFQPPPPAPPSTQLSASRVSRIPRATNRLARWLRDLRPTFPTARSPRVPAALPASSDSAAPALPPQNAPDDAHLERPAPPIPIHPRVADVIQRFSDGRLRHPSDILRPSERSYSLGVAVGLAAMKQRGHQDHLLGSSERMPPTFPPTALASDASIAATADWLLDAAIHAPPSHTELPHITGPAHVMGEQGLAIADLPDWFRTLDKRQRAKTPSPCRASATPPRPYERRPDTSVRLRTLLQLLCRGAKPVLSSAVDGATRVRIRRTGGLAAQYASLTDAEAATYAGHRHFLLALAAALSHVPSFGGYKSKRISRAVMGVFPPIAADEWRTRTWQDIVDISVDSKSKLFPDGEPIFPLDTPAWMVAEILQFPPEHLSMYLCCVDANLQKGASSCPDSLPADSLTPLALGRPLPPAGVLRNPRLSVLAASMPRSLVTALHVHRHQKLLACAADPSAYHTSTRRLHGDFLSLLADRRPTTPSAARLQNLPYYAPAFPYQAHECHGPIRTLAERIRRLIASARADLSQILPDFRSCGTLGRPGSATDAAYHILLGAKHVGQRCRRGASIAMGVGRDRRGNFQRLDGLSTTFCMASEHAFLEDISRPPVRLFVDNVVCDVYNCLLGQSYACRALLPCIERTDTERDSAVRIVHKRHPAHPARSALAVLASFGAIHVPPDAHHDTFVRDARSNGTAVGPLDAAALQLGWNQTHPTPDIAHMLDCAPPRLLRRLSIWVENPGAGALFRWLYPRLREIYGIDLRNATHVARLTHCCGGGAGWRKYTQILSTDPGLRHRIGVCGPSPALNCGHAKRHEITFAGNTPLPDDAMGIKHSIPPRLYDALVAPLAAVIPPSDRHLYLIVHLGSGSQSSRHLCARGFPVAFVDYERSVTNNFRTVRPTVVADYDSYASITEVVALAARRAGFHPDAVVGILFDPCCVTRTPMTNMNRKHRYPSGQPLPSPDGDEAQTRDDRDAYHIADLDQLSVRRDTLIADRLSERGPLPDSLPDDDGNDDNPVNEGAGTPEGAVDLATADSNASSSASTDLARTADLTDTLASRTTGFTSADACQTASATPAATNLVCATDPDVGSVTSEGDGASEHNTGDDDGDAESVAHNDDDADGSEDSADGAADGGDDDGDEDDTHDDSDAGNSSDDESDDDDDGDMTTTETRTTETTTTGPTGTTRQRRRRRR